MKIVPAILAENFQQLQTQYEKLKDFSNYLHIDVMDGELVPTKSARPEDFNRLNIDARVEIHLMVNHPIDWVPWYDLAKVDKFIFHSESLDDFGDVINLIRFYGKQPVLAINPETPVARIGSLVERVEGVQVMCVNPGRQGASFLPENLTKVQTLHKKYKDLPLSIDGGVNLQNFEEIARLPLSQVVIGHSIVKTKNPQLAYSDFTNTMLKLNP